MRGDDKDSFGLCAGVSGNLLPDERELVGSWVIYCDGYRLAHVDMQGMIILSSKPQFRDLALY